MLLCQWPSALWPISTDLAMETEIQLTGSTDNDAKNILQGTADMFPSTSEVKSTMMNSLRERKNKVLGP